MQFWFKSKIGTKERLTLNIFRIIIISSFLQVFLFYSSLHGLIQYLLKNHERPSVQASYIDKENVKFV